MKILNFLILLTISNFLFSIPNFSRKYEVSCSACHTVVPDLKDEGKKFLKNGYRFDENERKNKVEISDQFLYLPKEIPISFLLNLNATVSEKEKYNYQTKEYEKKDKLDFIFPYNFKLLSSGILYKNISYYFSLVNANSLSSNISDVYFYIKLLKKFPLYIKFGQFQVSDQMFKSNLRLENSYYDVYIASPNYSFTNLYYDKGIQLMLNKENWEAILGVYNGGNRFVLPNPNLPREPINNFNEEIEYDRDLSKNYSLRIKREFSNTSLGIFYYSGRDHWELTYCEHECQYKTIKNKLSYQGIDFSIKIKEKLKINAQYLKRKDDNLLLNYYMDYALLFKESKMDGGFLELLFFPKGYDGKFVISLLYNKGNSELPDFSFYNKTQEYYELDFSNISLGLNYLLSRNIKFLAELKRDFEREKNRFTLGFIAYF